MANIIQMTVTYSNVLTGSGTEEIIPSEIKYLEPKGFGYKVGRASSQEENEDKIIISPKAGRTISREHLEISLNNMGDWQAKALTDFPTVITHSNHRNTKLSQGATYELPTDDDGDVNCGIQLGDGSCYLILTGEGTINLEDQNTQMENVMPIQNLTINGKNLINEVSHIKHASKLLTYLYINRPEYIQVEDAGNHIDPYIEHSYQVAKNVKSFLNKELKKISDIADESVEIDVVNKKGWRLIIKGKGNLDDK